MPAQSDNSQLSTLNAQLLKQYWGYDSFRGIQEEIINSISENKDTLGLMPTGGGKSITFQVPALAKDGLCLVITPLIALMKDQVQNLRKRGIKALSIYSGMSRQDIITTLENCIFGNYKFLYISPERLDTEIFRTKLRKMKVSMITVDESHCISQWGYDFRPAYLKIAEIRELLPDVPVLALTATATPEVVKDIQARLHFRRENVFRMSFERSNLAYIVRKTDNKTGELLHILRSMPGSAIVYVRNRRRTKEITELLNNEDITADFYHAGLDDATKDIRQHRWQSGGSRVMVATNAFGMGIDKPDVRFVVHYDLPESPEAYFQEAGRAGRDGKRSFAVQLWNSVDVRRAKQIEDVSFPSLEYIEDVYQKLHAFFEIPYDTGMGRQLKFKIEDFCKRFGLQRAPAFYALKYLERTDHLTYSEEVDIPTKVRINVDRKSLYDVELADQGQANVLEELMRSYTGIFSFLQQIDEEYVARRAGQTVPQLRQSLYGLSLAHVISYVPTDHSDVVVLHHDRLRPGNVNLMPSRYAMLRESFHARAEAMLEYVSETSECRSRYLLRYFGQTEAADCGTCDVCRARRASLPARTLQQMTRRKLIEYIDEKDGEYSLEEIVAEFGNPSGNHSPDYLDILRQLIDNGDVPMYIS